MINFNNHNINEIHYDSHDIQYVYGCDGRMVWSKEHIYDNDYFTTVILNDGIFGHYNTNVEYSMDGGETWTKNESMYFNARKGDVILWRYECPIDKHVGTFFSSDYYGTTSDFIAQGNVMSLVFGDNFRGQTSLDGHYNPSAAAGVLQSLLANSKVVNAENMVLPATTIEQWCYQQMFMECRKLVTPPKVLPADVIMNGCYKSMFHNCIMMRTAPEILATKLDDSVYNASVAACQSMFANCASLVKAPSIMITNTPTHSLSFYNGMFGGCSKLNEITCLQIGNRPKHDTLNWVLNVSPTGTFYKHKDATWTTGVNGIPAGWVVKDYEPPTPPFTGKWLATYQDGSTIIGECDSSSAITNGEIVKENLVSVEIGDDCVTSIGNSAFFNYTSLTSCTIGSGVTSIGDSAFRYCTSLTSCTIGSGVTSIGQRAFQACRVLTSVTILNPTPPTLGTDAFNNTNDCPIYVPAESVSLYKSASGWRTYASRIRAIQ